jgi:mono/diheme cytochrome c family protein
MINKKICKTFFLTLTLAALLTSCGKDPQKTGRTYVPDMAYSQAFETYSENPNFDDGMTARKPVQGTIPRGVLPASGDNAAANLSYMHKTNFPNTAEGYEAAGAQLQNPLELNDKVLEEGKALYTIYCQVCHGTEGKGDGAIVQRGVYPPVPAYAERLPTINEGKMFHSITYGRNLMGGHASQVSAEDRWKLVHYISKLGKTGAFAEKPAATETVAKK